MAKVGLLTVPALIQSVLGEIEKTSGKILVEGKVSFTAQNPFVFSGTVRENVLFGEEMDRERYERTLEVTCLQPDIQSFENGDMTIIGDRGVSLSGGQKARIRFGPLRLSYFEVAPLHNSTT